jgi:fatty-acid desaturase
VTFVWIAPVQVTAVVGLVTSPVPGRALCLMAGALTWIGGLGTTVCYHRAPAHRGLRLHPVVREILIFFLCTTAQAGHGGTAAAHRR